LIIAVSISTAEDSEPKKQLTARRFAASLEITYDTCKVVASTDILIHDPSFSKTRSRVAESKADVSKKYLEIKNLLVGSLSATDALKNLYVCWMTGMDTILPQNDETKIGYNKRVSDRLIMIVEKGNILKLETNDL